MRPVQRCLAVADFEREARRFLPHCVFEYVRGGTEDEQSLRANRAAFDRFQFRPRGLNDVSARTQTVRLFDREYASPIGIAPTGLAGIVRHRCDLLLAGQAAHAGLPFILSGASNVPLEDLRSAGLDCWYQAYLPGDREKISALLGRLEKARVDVLVVTIDTCVGANRENNQRNRFTVPFRPSASLLWDGVMHPRWSTRVFARTLLASGIPRFANMTADAGVRITQDTPDGFRSGRDRLTWDHMRWLRERWKGRLVLKGVMHPLDAACAEQIGADAVIVSNHGGRQLDGTMSTLDALRQIKAQVSTSFPVCVDGGFRRGTDVLKAIALGARLVFLGRPFLYGAAVGAGAGIARVAEILREEIDRDLALLGCTSLDAVTSDCLFEMPPPAEAPSFTPGRCGS